MDLRGYPVILVDTAGIRESADAIEQEGVRRARERAAHADLTLWLVDGPHPERASAAGPTLIVRTKADLVGSGADSTPAAEFAISAKTGEGIVRLLEAIADLAVAGMSAGEPAVLSLARHRQAFMSAREAMEPAVTGEALDLELAAEHFRAAAAAMDRVVGRIGVEDVLGQIFARFCVGK